MNDKSSYIIESGIEYYVFDCDNFTAYYLNNRKRSISRTNGAAVIWKDNTVFNKIGGKEYWLNGEKYPEITSDEEWILFQIIT